MVAGLAVLILVAAAIGLYRYLGHATPAAFTTNWEQLTFFTDSAVYPALSPDGRMLAFIRGDNTFFGKGDIYVKMLPFRGCCSANPRFAAKTRPYLLARRLPHHLRVFSVGHVGSPCSGRAA